VSCEAAAKGSHLSKPGRTTETKGHAPDEDAESTALAQGDSWYREYASSNPQHGSNAESSTYFARVFEDAPAAYIVTDPNMLIRDANKAAQRLLNRALAALRGKPIFSIVAKEERRAFHALTPELLDVQTVMTRPLRIQPARGETIDAFFSACTARNENGKPEAVFWIFMQPLESRNEDLL
jgi:PAS domain S-box-containing protein